MNPILVPIDFSDVSGRVLAKAAELAGATRAKLVLLHVVEPETDYVPVGGSMDVAATAVPAMVYEDTETPSRRLEELAAPLRERGLEVDVIVTLGIAVDDILQRAEALDASIIALGSHGHGALYHLFAGSVVTGVLHAARSPVLVVPIRKK